MVSQENKTGDVHVSKKNEADKIWEEIKGKPINMFALPNQRVIDHLDKINVPGDVLYVRLASGATVVSLEEAIGKEYELEQVDNYTIIRRVPVSPVPEEKSNVRRRR